ncbi:MAG: phosphoadenosine phosphosulfate reductase family protein [Tatlockia sp.]|nr:phosphoadenosine phosphosulfate reductase family protein [Tatlockia sp.]
MKKNLIIGNFGNHSLAAMQALIEREVLGLHFVYVKTGWAAERWVERVNACTEYACRHGVEVHELNALATFSEMVLDRKQFPSPKFQWCASFLKGLPLINFLDNFDPVCNDLIVSGKRRLDSRRFAKLQEFDFDDEYYQGRTLWHPLWQLSDNEFKKLIKNTGFEFEPQPSLECSPCIHVRSEELRQLDLKLLERLESLELEIGQTMFQLPIKDLYVKETLETPMKNESKPCLQQFDRGCGGPWGCGE